MTSRNPLLGQLKARLDPLDGDMEAPRRGDGDLNGVPSPSGRALKPAAVIAPLILDDRHITQFMAFGFGLIDQLLEDCIVFGQSAHELITLFNGCQFTRTSQPSAPQ